MYVQLKWTQQSINTFGILFASPDKKYRSDFIGVNNKKLKKKKIKHEVKYLPDFVFFSVLFQVNMRCIFCLKPVALPLIGFLFGKKV